MADYDVEQRRSFPQLPATHPRGGCDPPLAVVLRHDELGEHSADFGGKRWIGSNCYRKGKRLHQRPALLSAARVQVSYFIVADYKGEYAPRYIRH